MKWIPLIILLMSCHNTFHSVAEEIPPFKKKGDIKIAFVLGGGGAKGLAIWGALQELHTAGIKPDLIVGCSAGSIAGALYADDQEFHGVCRHFVSLKRTDFLDISYFNPIFGIADGKRLQNILRSTLKSKTFEELKIPLIAVATDLQTGDVVEISQGDIASGVHASCAFPGMFKPVELYGRYLIDGGATLPVPVTVAKKHGAEVIIAIDVTGSLPKTSPQHLFGVGKRSLEIAYRKLVQHSLSDADYVIEQDFEGCGTFSDHMNEHLYEEGRKKIQAILPDIKKIIAVKLK